MKIGFLVLSTLLLVGCEEPARPDQCMRREIFQQCMKALPAGPQATKYNDWDEVVSQCESVAYHQSLRKSDSIKPECKL
jgi:hypothetical protein